MAMESGPESDRPSGATSARLDPDAQDGRGEERPPTPSELFSRLSALVAELKEYVAVYLSARIDGYKSAGRNLGVYAGMGIIGLAAAGAFVMTAVVLLLLGIAGGLGVLLRNAAGEPRYWL